MNRIAAVSMILATLLSPVAALCANKSAVEPQVLSLPKGPGSIEGLGESFEPQLNTGTATYRVSLAVPPGVNKHQPDLALVYNSGYGNSPLGLGWRLNVPYLQRQTDKGLPAYTDGDTFLHSDGGELVPLGGGLFRLKIEGPFLKFQRAGDGWEVWEKNGVHHYFGTTAASRLDTSKGTFEWRLAKSLDTNGNEIRYFYQKHAGQVYLTEIRYSLNSESVYKSVDFLYEGRTDAFTDYHSRSRILTARRLAAIEMRSQGTLVRKYQLTYQPGTDFSLLAQVVRLGSDGVSALPPMSFGYSAYSPAAFSTVAMTDPPPISISLTNPNADLIDIDGDGLPDLVHTDPSPGLHRFYINQGQGAWSPNPVTPDEGSPQYFLATDGVMMSDMNGDGLADLFIKNAYDFGYFRNRGQLAWEETDWVPFSPNPFFGFESQQVRLLDLNNDKLIDVLRDSGSSYQVWLNRKNGQWNAAFDYETHLPGGAHLNFSSPTTQLGDMNGDRMEDLVFVTDGYVSFFPSMGKGEFDAEVAMADPPAGLGSDAAKLTLTDLNNDGLADLAIVGNEHIRVWFNGGDGAFKPEVLFAGTPSTAGLAAYRFADMNGDGFRDLLITNESVTNRYQYVTFNNGVHPSLLTRIRNGLGQETSIAYRSSSEDYLTDRAAGAPWTRKLPFPVQVVSQVTVRDNNSGQEYVTDYHYRDGYYDGGEKEFRGFGGVRKQERGEPGAPGLLSQYAFDVGDEHESRKGMVTSLALLQEGGTLAPAAGLFEVADHTLTTRTLFTGTNSETVTYSFTSATATRVYEGGATPTRLLREWDQDERYGNVIKDLDYGIVAGADLGAGDDEVLTNTDYRIDEARWIIDRPSQIRKTRLDGGFVSRQKLTYDANGNLVLDERSPDGSAFIPVARNEYDAYGNLVKITDANGHWRAIAYDPTFHAFPVQETIGGVNLTLTAAYDLGLGLMTGFTEPNGHTTGFGYDPLGRLVSIVKPGDTAARPTQTFTYHLADPVSHILTRSREQSGQDGTYDTVSYFDGLGRKLQTRSEGEKGDWVVSEAATFNQRKGIKRQWLPYFDASPDYGVPGLDRPHTLFEYDARNRSVKETNPDGSYRTTVYQPLTKVAYDEEDNHPASPHQSTPHTFRSDGRNRLTRVEERNGAAAYITTYAYDGLDNLVRITDHEGNLKTLTFDGLGRKTFMNDPDKGVMSYQYDGAGNLLQTTDAKGQTVTYAYDAANRTVTETYQSVRARYHYDGDLPADNPGLQNTLGRLAWVEDEAGRELYSYDARGNRVRQLRGLNGLAFLTRMTYDALDRLTRLTYPDGGAVDYVYNAMSQLEAVPGFVSSIDYIATGQKAAFAYANGVSSAYDYDLRQRLSRLSSTRGGAVLQELTYAYDRVSNITRISDQRASKTPEDRTTDYAYDDLYRLTEAKAPAWTESYQYSSIGNMTFKSDLGAMTYGAGSAGPHALTGVGGASYSYDANGNLAAKPGYAYQFDHKDRLARVNRTSDGAVIDYAYDSGFDRKRKTVTLGGQSTTTLYVDRYTELRGDRLIKQVYAGDRLVARVTVAPFHPSLLAGWAGPLTVADFDVNPQDGVITLAEIQAQGANPNAVESAEAGDALRIYQANRETNPDLLPFATLAQALHEVGDLPGPAQSQTVFYLPDHLGSASLVTDASGAVVEQSVFYPYGQDRVRSGSYESEYRFTGKELDDETGLHYFGARYYDSVTGRFVSVDPLIHNPPNQRNFLRLSETYSYASDNPNKFVDPDGLFAIAVLPFVVGLTEAAVNVGSLVVQDVFFGKEVSGAEYAGAAVGGLVSGTLSTIALITGNPIGIVAAEAAGSFAGEITKQLLDDKAGIDSGEVTNEILKGTAIGIIDTFIPGSVKGYEPVIKGLMTKSARGHAKNMAIKTTTKIVKDAARKEILSLGEIFVNLEPPEILRASDPKQH